MSSTHPADYLIRAYSGVVAVGELQCGDYITVPDGFPSLLDPDCVKAGVVDYVSDFRRGWLTLIRMTSTGYGWSDGETRKVRASRNGYVRRIDAKRLDVLTPGYSPSVDVVAGTPDSRVWTVDTATVFDGRLAYGTHADYMQAGLDGMARAGAVVQWMGGTVHVIAAPAGLADQVAKDLALGVRDHGLTVTDGMPGPAEPTVVEPEPVPEPAVSVPAAPTVSDGVADSAAPIVEPAAVPAESEPESTATANPVREAIAAGTWDSAIIRLHGGGREGVDVFKLAGRLDRDAYTAVAAQLGRLGGHWRRDANGFVFARSRPVWPNGWSKGGQETVGEWLAASGDAATPDTEPEPVVAAEPEPEVSVPVAPVVPDGALVVQAPLFGDVIVSMPAGPARDRLVKAIAAPLPATETRRDTIGTADLVDLAEAMGDAQGAAMLRVSAAVGRWSEGQRDARTLAGVCRPIPAGVRGPAIGQLQPTALTLPVDKLQPGDRAMLPGATEWATVQGVRALSRKTVVFTAAGPVEVDSESRRDGRELRYGAPRVFTCRGGGPALQTGRPWTDLVQRADERRKSAGMVREAAYVGKLGSKAYTGSGERVSRGDLLLVVEDHDGTRVTVGVVTSVTRTGAVKAYREARSDSVTQTVHGYPWTRYHVVRAQAVDVDAALAAAAAHPWHTGSPGKPYGSVDEVLAMLRSLDATSSDRGKTSGSDHAAPVPPADVEPATAAPAPPVSDAPETEPAAEPASTVAEPADWTEVEEVVTAVRARITVDSLALRVNRVRVFKTSGVWQIIASDSAGTIVLAGTCRWRAGRRVAATLALSPAATVRVNGSAPAVVKPAAAVPAGTRAQAVRPAQAGPSVSEVPAGWVGEVARLTTADTAKLVRAALRSAFPGVRFSVRSDSYSGGSSIDVSWTDGPLTRTVERVTKPFAGARFDGMADMKNYRGAVLVTDGSGARAVNLGADFVMCHRTVSAERLEAMRGEAARMFGGPVEDGRLYRAGEYAHPEAGVWQHGGSGTDALRWLAERIDPDAVAEIAESAPADVPAVAPAVPAPSNSDKPYTMVEVSETKSDSWSVAPNGSARCHDFYTTVISRQTWTAGPYAGHTYKIVTQFISQDPNRRGQCIGSSSSPWPADEDATGPEPSGDVRPTTPVRLPVAGSADDGLDGVRAVLARADLDGCTLTIPREELPRDVWTSLHATMRGMGATGGSRKGQPYRFERDPRAVLCAFIAGGPAPQNERKSAGWVRTPDAVAADVVSRFVDFSGVGSADVVRVLEPSAGDGSLIRALLAACPGLLAITAIEPDSGRREALRDLAREVGVRRFANIDGGTLEDYAAVPETAGRFDLVVMNPPFSVPGNRTIWADHVRLAWGLLRDGGRLVAILPASYATGGDRKIADLRTLLDGAEVTDLPAGAFEPSGTDVRTCVVAATKRRVVATGDQLYAARARYAASIYRARTGQPVSVDRPHTSGPDALTRPVQSFRGFAGDVVVRYVGDCIGCGSPTWSDGDCDPRGPVGMATVSTLYAQEYEQDGPDVCACWKYMDSADSYRRAVDLAQTLWSAPTLEPVEAGPVAVPSQETPAEPANGGIHGDGRPPMYGAPAEWYAPDLDSDGDDAPLSITHTHEDGTRFEGGRKGDGTYEILQQHRFTWRRGPGVHIPHSRDRFADLDAIGKAAVALREAGHRVSVDVDDVWRPAEQREEHRAELVERSGKVWTVVSVWGGGRWVPAAWAAADVDGGLLRCSDNYERRGAGRARGLYRVAYRQRHRTVVEPCGLPAVTYLFAEPIPLHLGDGWVRTGVSGTSRAAGAPHDWWELLRPAPPSRREVNQTGVLPSRAV